MYIQLIGEPDEYITYEGTMTEPPCEDGVMWILLTSIKSLSER